MGSIREKNSKKSRDTATLKHHIFASQQQTKETRIEALKMPILHTDSRGSFTIFWTNM